MFKIYKIQDGENIEDIANKFTTTTDDLYDINGFDRNYAFDPGQLLIVPNIPNQIYQKYTVKKGDNVFEIAKKFGTDVDTIILINGLDKADFIYPNQELLVPTGNVEIYVTKGRDTLRDVADKLNTSREVIVKENDNIVLIPDQIIIHKKENIQ